MQKNTYGNKIPPRIKSENESDSLHTAKQGSPLVIPSDCEPTDEAFAVVVDDLINDVILDFCFQVHRASKVGLFKPEDDEAVSNETEDIFGQIKGKLRVSKVDCPNCPRKIEATRFAKHFEKCNGNGNGRQSGRNAIKKLTDTVESDCDDDDENESDFSYSLSSKKRPKKKTGKGAPRKRANKDPFMPSSSAENSGSLQPTFDTYEQFLSQFCGVKSKHTKKMCMNTLKCSQHTEEQRKQIRIELLSNFIVEPKPEDVHIDVDTVDEENSGVYLTPSVSRSSSPELFQYSE